ncbi:MAG: lipopolysaccharide biosynthesis protein, partial [bacterium]
MLKRKILTNTAFNISSQILGLVFGVVLARLLFPRDFGIYGISLLCIEIAVFLSFEGFDVALIQNKQTNEKYYGSVFWFYLIVNSILAILIFVSAPTISVFFKMPPLTLLLKWHVIVLIIAAFRPISSVILTRDLKFKELGIATFLSKTVTGISSIIFVLFKFGALSLVLGSILGELTSNLVSLYFVLKTKQHLIFKLNFNILKDLSHVGIGVTLQQVFGYVSGNVDYFLLGKLTSAEILGFYTKAFKLMTIPVRQVSRNISKVLLSGFSQIQDDNEQIINKFLKIVQATSLVTFPLFLICYIYSPGLIFFVYGERWMPTVIPFRILILAGAIKSLSTYLGDILKAKGLVFYELLVQVGNALIIGIGGFFAILRWEMKGSSYIVVLASIIFWIAMLIIFLNTLELSALRYFKVLLPSTFICVILTLWNIFLKGIVGSNNTLQTLIIGILSSLFWYIFSIIIIKNYCLLNLEIDRLYQKLTIFFYEM